MLATYVPRLPPLLTLIISVVFLGFVIAAFVQMQKDAKKKKSLSQAPTASPEEAVPDELRISLVAQDPAGNTLFIKIIHPGVPLDASYTAKMDVYLTSLKAKCAQENHPFQTAAKFMLPPETTVTPEFTALLARHGLDPATCIMAAPPTRA